tara:strand:- start:312 stop:545 length:234 start_codon:yes stop_codon:yes gene_type:complete
MELVINNLIMFLRNKIGIFMQLSIIALASSEWGIARFTTDSFALIALGILAGLPFLLLNGKAGLKNIWTSGNALSDR